MKRIGLIFLLICILSTGCSKKVEDNKEDHKVNDQTEFEQQVENFLNGYQKKDETVFKMLIGGMEENLITYDGISGYFAEKMNYSIKSCEKVDEANYNVDIEVKTIDFEKLFTSSFEETIKEYGEEGITDNFLNAMELEIKEDVYETKTFNCTVIVRKNGAEYKILMNNSLANALTGGMNEYLYSLQGFE